MVLANICFAVLPLAVKWSGRLGAHGALLTFYRHLFAFIAVLLLAAFRVQRLEVKRPRVLFWRGLFGGVAVFLWFFSIDLTSAAKATVLNYTHPLWSNAFSALLFRVRRPAWYWGLYAIAFAGLVLVVDPSLTQVNWGDVLALGSGASGGAAVLSVKEARKTENALSIFAAFSTIGLLVAVLYLWCLPERLGGAPLDAALALDSLTRAWWPILLTAVFAVCGQLLFTHGYAYTSLTLGTALSFIVPVLASFGGWLLFGESLPPHFWIGASMVMGVAATVTRWETRTSAELSIVAAAARDLTKTAPPHS